MFSNEKFGTFLFLLNDPILPKFGHDVKTIKWIGSNGTMKDDDYRSCTNEINVECY